MAEVAPESVTPLSRQLVVHEPSLAVATKFCELAPAFGILKVEPDGEDEAIAQTGTTLTVHEQFVVS